MIRNFFFLAFMLIVFIPAIYGQTNIFGDVSGTWTKSGSPFVVTGDAKVPDGTTLTIEPGVEVRFDGKFKLEVDGELIAIGTVADSILFTRNRAADDSKWLGIQLIDADAVSSLEYCIIEFCEVTSGSYRAGGALHLENSSATVSHSTIRNNKATLRGGGVYCSASALTLDNVSIIDNDASGYSGSFNGGGGIFMVSNSEVIVNNSKIANNFTRGNGGGIHCNSAMLRVFNSQISGNGAHGRFSSEGQGGGIYARDTDEIFLGNTFLTGNTVSEEGGGFYSNNASGTSINVTVADNEADDLGGGLYLAFGSFHTINNSILWGNTAGFSSSARIGTDSQSGYAIHYTDGGFNREGIGNIFSDPLFSDPGSGDYSLQPGSPALNVGNPSAFYNDLDGSRNDMGATGGSSLYVNFTEYDYGITAVGTSESSGLKITNTRGTDFTISSLTVGDAANYSVLQTAPVTIPPLSDTTLTISFSPQTADSIATDLTLMSNDLAGTTSAPVPLLGEGVAGTLVSGSVNGRWTAANAPYFVDGDLLVAQNDSLIIEPGVDVLFDGAHYLFVEGTLISMGDESAPVLLTRRLPSYDSMWQGIRFNRTSTVSFLRHTRIEYARNRESFSNGGGVYCNDSSPVLANCVIVRNRASRGAGLYINGNSHPLLLNVTVTQNNSQGIFVGFRASVRVVNSIIYSNSSEEIDLSNNSFAEITYSDVGDGWEGKGNIAVDPQFVDFRNDDFSLKPTSPCINAGDPFPIYNDTDGSRNDMGPTGGSGLHINASDFDYGNIGTGATKTLNIELWNVREADLPLQSFTFSDPANFITAITPPVNAPAHSRFDIPVTFQPQNKGDFSTTLAINSDALFGASQVDFSFQGSSGGTSVSGNARGTWNTDGSPYVVTGDVTVAAEDSLFIQPGVEVKFDGPYGFVVYGYLDAAGTESDSIVFTRSRLTDDSRGKGVRFIDSDKASRIEYCRFEYGKADQFPATSGGGVYCENSTLNIAHSLFKKNFSSSGAGGLHIRKGSIVNISQSVFEANESDNVGGGVYTDQSTAHFSDCIFKGNMTRIGGGLYAWASKVDLINCVFDNNSASQSGGGIQISSSKSKAVLRNVTIKNNTSRNRGGGFHLSSNAVSTATNCVIVNNKTDGSTGKGGGIYVSFNGYLSMFNCTIANNIASNTRSDDPGHGIYQRSEFPVIVNNSIIWDNGGADAQQIYVASNSPFLLQYSTVQGGWPGTGNLADDPLFTDPANGNFKLQSGSPAKDAGIPSAFFNDFDGTRNDMGFEGGSLLIPNFNAFDFGDFVTNASKSIDFKLLNLRDENFSIDTLSLTDDVNFSTTATTPRTIAPLMEDTITVTFNPQTIGSHETNLTLSSSQFSGAGSAGVLIRGTALPGTAFSGTASGVWSIAQNPYVIIGDVTVEDSTELRIEPGVEIRFDGFHGFDVRGKLIADGTVSDSIRFLPHQPFFGAGSWPGIRFKNAESGTILNYCVIERAAHGVWIVADNDTTLLDITNSAIRFNSRSGIFIDADDDGVALPNIIGNNIHRNSDHGIYVTADQNTGAWPNPIVCAANPVISKNRIFNNINDGIRCFADGTSFFVGFRIFRGKGYANPEISFNVIDNNRDRGIVTIASEGATLEEVEPLIINNTIYGNSDGGIQAGDKVTPDKFKIINNIIVANGFRGIEVKSDSIPTAKYNDVWGQSNDFVGFPESYGKLATTNNKGDSTDIHFNLSLDPMFVVPAVGDYRLAVDSPCIDAGDPTLPRNADGTMSDIGASEATDVTVDVADSDSELPTTFELFQNFPNPFNPETTIRYQLPKQAEVRLVIYNVLGRKVETLVDQKQPAGIHTVQWLGKSPSGEALPSGIYFIRMKAGAFVRTRKMALVR